jgi:hypothetical protein
MFSRTRTSERRSAARLAALAALPLLFLAPLAARAFAEEALEDGPGAGTEFVACQNTAWSDYNSCLMSSDHEWEKKLCDLAFEADIAWCGSVYYRRLKTGT